ncbi:MAG: SGNH/GDSL hydrolase family protein [Polyangiaceae bacterium]
MSLVVACNPADGKTTAQPSAESPSVTNSAAPSAAPSAPAPTPVVSAPADAAAAPGPLTLTQDGKVVPAAQAKRVLHVGDSMVPLVGNYLRPIFQKDGRKYYIESVTSSSTLSWDNKRLLQDAMYKYDPDLILISLGSNELFDRNPERRVPAIKRLVQDTRGRPCLWIGPPAWKEDYGFIAVLKQNLGHCRYLDSVALKLPRMADGRHPSWTGGYRWSVAVWKELGGTGEVPDGNPRPD